MFKYILIFFIKLYQYCLSPFLTTSKCRFLPTCSEYAIEALKNYGVIKGSILAIKRLAKCHPFSKKSGIDELPPKDK